MIIHIQTNIQTIFGKLDNEGNVIEQIPLNITGNALKPEVFQEAYNQLKLQKEKLQEKDKPQEKEEKTK